MMNLQDDHGIIHEYRRPMRQGYRTRCERTLIDPKFTTAAATCAKCVKKGSGEGAVDSRGVVQSPTAFSPTVAVVETNKQHAGLAEPQVGRDAMVRPPGDAGGESGVRPPLSLLRRSQLKPNPPRKKQTNGWKDPQHALVLDGAQNIARPHVSEDAAETRRLLEHRAERLTADHVRDTTKKVDHETKPRERAPDIMPINPMRLTCGESEESKTFIDKLKGVKV